MKNKEKKTIINSNEFTIASYPINSFPSKNPPKFFSNPNKKPDRKDTNNNSIEIFL